ncbi:MAG TPA: Ku protein [Tepidisphaeraceae bacterium]|jgi:DNA end-binding protein Ku|nr:Ku protein [Tepidisphaeraceae bacterium]
MPRAIWSGSISFGLVNIPVKMFIATKEKRVQFHMLHDQDKSRLQFKRVSSSSGREVHNEHIVKGYEIGPDQYVIVEQSELEALAPKQSRMVEIKDFVNLDEIDPLYYDKGYYLAPGEHAAKPYKLLVEAMEKSKRVAIASFVMREKEYLAAMRPVEGVLCLETMHFGDEVLDPKDVVDLPSVKVDDREVNMAQKLIDSLTTNFDPKKYKDEYREKVLDLIEHKAKGEEVVTQPPAQEKPGRTINLMAALEASLAEARKEARGGGTTTARRTRHVHQHPGTHHRRRKSA